jgi:ABC-type transporter Mla subunit MlaD
MTDPDQPGRAGQPAPPAGVLPFLEWTQGVLDASMHAQARLAAENLRKINAPIVEALERQNQLARSLAASAEQIRTVAEQVEQLASQHAAVTAQLRAALGPYLRYVEWLGQVGES